MPGQSVRRLLAQADFPEGDVRPMLQVMAVVLLCGGAVAAAAQDAGVDARLVEAQTAYEEATKLGEAGKYADAIAKAERALALREDALGGTHLKVAECLNL